MWRISDETDFRIYRQTLASTFVVYIIYDYDFIRSNYDLHTFFVSSRRIFRKRWRTSRWISFSRSFIILFDLNDFLARLNSMLIYTKTNRRFHLTRPDIRRAFRCFIDLLFSESSLNILLRFSEHSV